MKLTLVVHENRAHDPHGNLVVCRPVVGEEVTNRGWSPKAVPTGELRLHVTDQKLIEALAVGRRLDLDLDLLPAAPKG